jgi:PAS domain S-box-containing protein
MNNKSSTLNTLRTKAEEQLCKVAVPTPITSSAEELLFELQTHQIELEMQNHELQRTYAALEESRDRYAALYDYSPVGFITLTDDGLISEANLTAADLLGIERENLISRRFAALVASQDGDRWYLFFSNIMKRNQRLTIELSLKGCNNTEFPVQLKSMCVNSTLHITLIDMSLIVQENIFPIIEAITITESDRRQLDEIQKKSLNLLQNIIRDERKQMELIRGEALTRLQKISRSLPGVIFQYCLRPDGSSFFPYVSEAIQTIFRLSPEEVQNDASKVFYIIHPDDYEGYCNSLRESAENQTPWNHEYRVKFDDGTLNWLLGNALPDRKADGSTLWHGFITDISDRILQEQKDKQHLDELAHITRLGLMGELASGIAHEVNQPLTAISTYAQVIINLIKNKNPDLPKLAEVAFKTQQQALRAGRIIHRMKEFVKSHEKKRSLTNINTLILNSIEMCNSELGQNNIKPILELEQKLPTIHVDQIQIEQVIINLVRNSVDALLISPENKLPQITIQSRLLNNNDIQVSVKDNGLGMTEEQQQKIFMPFHTTKASGMGMGLSISRSLIESHKGSLHFTSNYGTGSTFYFTLPITLNAPASPVATSQESSSSK